jgi:HAE1 family hydrophobic/amphiphilic exporter-1
MKKSVAAVAFVACLSLLVVTPGFGQGFLLNPFIGPYRAPQVELQTLRATPTVPESVNALVQNGGLPISMNDMVRLTLENNFNLGIQRFSPFLSEYGILQAQTSFDPTLSLNGSVSRNTRATTSQTEGAAVQSTLGGSYGATFSQNLKTGGNYSIRASVSRSSSNNAFATFNPSWSGSMSYSFSQPLLRGFGIGLNTAPIVIARNNLENSRIAFEQQVMDLVLQSTNLYWDLAYSNESIRVRQNALDLSRRTLAENERRVDIGTLAPIDLAQSRFDVSSQEAQLLTAQNSRRQIEDNVKTMITRIVDPGLFLVALNPTDSIENRTATILPVAEAIQLAYRTRPDMRQFELDMENAELNMMTARNNLLPNLNLNVSYNHNGQAGRQLIRDGLGGPVIGVLDQGLTDLFGNIFGFDQNGYNIGFSLNLPLGNRASRIGYERQVINNRTLESRREVLMQSIAQEVRNAFEQVQLARQQVVLSEGSYDLAQISLNSENRKFELGQSQLRFVIQEQNNLTSSEVSLLNARINYIKAVAQYDRSIGRTLELNNVQIQEEYRPNLASDTAPGVATR